MPTALSLISINQLFSIGAAAVKRTNNLILSISFQLMNWCNVGILSTSKGFSLEREENKISSGETCSKKCSLIFRGEAVLNGYDESPPPHRKACGRGLDLLLVSTRYLSVTLIILPDYLMIKAINNPLLSSQHNSV